MESSHSPLNARERFRVIAEEHLESVAAENTGLELDAVMSALDTYTAELLESVAIAMEVNGEDASIIRSHIPKV